MNTLSYKCTEDNGLSFELLVDGQPLGALVGSRDAAFPYWIVEDGLPRPYGYGNSTEEHIICVCNCGEYGCGHTRCRVIRNGDDVVFCEFSFDVSREGTQTEFRFSAANYDAVCGEIVAHARLHAAKMAKR